MTEPSGNNALFTLGKWIITLFTLLMVVTAALVGNGMFRGTDGEWMTMGHMHLGNLLFAMAVVQMVICYIMFTRKQLSGWVMLASALVLLFTFGQIGLGYSTRTNYVDVVGWHIGLGVLLTAATAMLTTMLWMPANRPDGGNTAS